MKNVAIYLIPFLISFSFAQEDLPPAYPREGAERMLENDHVIVWDISWLKGEYPVHRHRYDHTGVYYSPGDRIITSVEGEAREVSTPAWRVSFQLAGVTHTESGVSDDPLQAVFIQIKRPVTGPSLSRPTVAQFPVGEPLERLSNQRVRVWEYSAGNSYPGDAAHFYPFDSVIVWFNADNQPNASFVLGGTSLGDEISPQAERIFVFEIL